MLSHCTVIRKNTSRSSYITFCDCSFETRKDLGFYTVPEQYPIVQKLKLTQHNNVEIE